MVSSFRYAKIQNIWLKSLFSHSLKLNACPIYLQKTMPLPFFLLPISWLCPYSVACMGGGHAVADALSEVERRAMMKILIVMIIHIGLFFRSSSAPNDMTFSNSLYDNGLRNGCFLATKKALLSRQIVPFAFLKAWFCKANQALLLLTNMKIRKRTAYCKNLLIGSPLV